MPKLIERFDDFVLEVDRHVLSSRIDKSQRNTRFSVTLDASTKLKIHHYIEQIRETVDAIEIPKNKKDIIYKKINDLSLEIDTARTRLEIVADVLITMANTAEEVGRKLNPVRKMIDSITSLLGKAQETEELLRFPIPEERKRLPAPRKRRRAAGSDADEGSSI